MSSSSRRDFLKGAIVGLGTLVLPSDPKTVLRELKRLIEPAPTEPEPYPLEQWVEPTPREWDWAAEAWHGPMSSGFVNPYMHPSALREIDRHVASGWTPHWEDELVCMDGTRVRYTSSKRGC